MNIGPHLCLSTSARLRLTSIRRHGLAGANLASSCIRPGTEGIKSSTGKGLSSRAYSLLACWPPAYWHWQGGWHWYWHRKQQHRGIDSIGQQWQSPRMVVLALYAELEWHMRSSAICVHPGITSRASLAASLSGDLPSSKQTLMRSTGALSGSDYEAQEAQGKVSGRNRGGGRAGLQIERDLWSLAENPALCCVNKYRLLPVDEQTSTSGPYMSTFWPCFSGAVFRCSFT